MKLIHLTVRKFQHLTADGYYVASLAKEFSKILRADYLLVAGNKTAEQFVDVNVVELSLKTRNGVLLNFWWPYLYSFAWLPFFLINNKNDNVVFFSSDHNLLTILIFWKKLLGLHFKICSDWHMLYNNFRDKFVPRNSDFLITTSEKLRKMIIERSGINEQKVLTVYGGVNLAQYRDIRVDRRGLGLPQDKILVAYVGLFKTMGMEKGLKTMIEALRYLDEKFMMVFVGSKPGQTDEYAKVAQGYGVRERCLFVAIQPAEKVPLYEKAMDILVIPYPDQPHFREYGFPMKVYEYMASGRPIVYSRLELTEEVLHDRGYLFEPDDARDLARAINDVSGGHADVRRRSLLLSEGLSEYSWQVKAEKILSFINFKK